MDLSMNPSARDEQDALNLVAEFISQKCTPSVPQGITLSPKPVKCSHSAAKQS